MIKVGIIGGAGYTAGELIRLLVNHPEAEISFVHSKSNANKSITDVHSGLIGDIDLKFSESYDLNNIDVLFMCCAHGDSKTFIEKEILPAGLRIIDLSQDFRDESCGFVYGLPEYCKERIQGATKIANPGCFATAIQLALLPVASAGCIDSEVEIVAITGSTGAGVKPSVTTHFSYRTNNISTYKEFSHQHLKEISKTLTSLNPQLPGINFIPVRGDFARGIFVTAHFHTALTQDQAYKLYSDFYSKSSFTHVTNDPIDLKQVVNTNKALVHVCKHDQLLHVTTAIDNLLKGASGQAVQNMNLMFNFPEKAGLKLKASAF